MPAVFGWMCRSAFRRGAATALSLRLAHFPEDFILDDITSGYPVLVGEITGRDVGERLPASLAAALAAVARGAAIVRVHDVRETVDALKVWRAVECAADVPRSNFELGEVPDG